MDWRRELRAFWEEEDGVGVIEVVLILVVLIGLVIIFKKQINDLLRTCSRRSTNSRKRCTDEKKRQITVF